MKDRREAYSSCQVVYGDVGAFQRDLLQDGFYGEDNGFGSRRAGCVVVDEVGACRGRPCEMPFDAGWSDGVMVLSKLVLPSLFIKGMDK